MITLKAKISFTLVCRVLRFVEYATRNLLGWVGLQVGNCEDLGNGTCGLFSLVFGINGGCKARFTRSTVIDTTSMQHSLRKQPPGPRRKQAHMASQTTLDPFERSIKIAYNKTELN